MSKLVINNLPENKELDRQALAEFKGGFNPPPWLEQIAKQPAEAAKSAETARGHANDQEPELGVSPELSSFELPKNQPSTPHS